MATSIKCDFCGLAGAVGRKMATDKTCRICGAAGLHWHKRQGAATFPHANVNFFLYNEDATPHSHRPGDSDPRKDDAPMPRVDLSDVERRLSEHDTHLEAHVVTLANHSNMIDDARDQLTTLTERVEKIDVRREITITIADREPVDVGRQHRNFPILVETAANIDGTGVPYLLGGAGSGKTFAIRPLALALGVPDGRAEIEPIDPTKAPSAIYGFIGPVFHEEVCEYPGCEEVHGYYVPTKAYHVCKLGGVLGFDEFDAGGPAMVAANALMANEWVGFPTGTFQKHPQCYIVAMGNTPGRGATAEYNARAKLDDATRSRFVYIPWDVDWELTAEISGNGDWTAYIHRIAEICKRLNVRTPVSPRMANYGARLLAAGMDREIVENNVIWLHFGEDDAAKVRNNLK